jgi:hypothetical protein
MALVVMDFKGCGAMPPDLFQCVVSAFGWSEENCENPQS